MSELIQLTGLWANKDKNGETYLTGNLGSARIVVFKNKHKKESKHPDFIAYVSAQERREDKTEASKDPLA